MIDEGLAERLAALRARIQDRSDLDVTLVAVTKGFGPETAHAAYEVGLVDLGENYSQELEAKAASFPGSGPRWHFIGRLQRNKVRRIAPLVQLWQTVDRPRLITEIATRAPGAAILIQVNVSEEETKGGCQPTEAETLVSQAVSVGLDVRGLMTVGTTGSAEDARPGFRRLRQLCDQLGLAVCSMGMTNDFETALDEGSTMVRIGTALFGPRPPKG